MTDPALMDREEHQRVMALRQAARSRPHLTEGRASQAARRVDRKRNSGRRTMYVRPRVLAYSSASALGDAIRKVMVERIEYRLQQGATVAHVKDGKPLTEHGARLLGVAWTPAEAAVGEA